jgi:hypothetical protein
MNRNGNIGGPLGMEQYAILAQKHRPSEPQTMAAEIKRLRATGLSARDISAALRLLLTDVIDVLGESGRG